MATTPQEVWQLLGELIQAQKETERRFQETESLIKEQSQEADRRFQDTERLIKEQNQRLNSEKQTRPGRCGRTPSKTR